MNKGELVDVIVSKVELTNYNCKVFVTDQEFSVLTKFSPYNQYSSKNKKSIETSDSCRTTFKEIVFPLY